MDVGVLKVLQKCCQFAKWLVAQLSKRLSIYFIHNV